MKKYLGRLAGIAMFGMLAPTAFAQEVTLTLGHVHNEQGTFHILSTRLAELLAEKSDGRIAVEIFPNASLGGELRMVQSARSGSLDMTFTSDAALESTVQQYRVLSIPYLFDSIDDVNETLAGEVGDQLLDALNDYGLQGLAWAGKYQRNIAAKKPVNVVTDANGLKIRVPQSPGYISGYEALGAQPTPMAYGEIYLAFQSGVVDAIDTPPEQIITDGFAEIVTDYSITRMTYSKTLLVMSLDRFEALPEDLQAILREAAGEMGQYAIQLATDTHNTSLEKLRELGIAIHEPDLTPFIEATKGTWDELLGGDAFMLDVVAQVTGDTP